MAFIIILGLLGVGFVVSDELGYNALEMTGVDMEIFQGEPPVTETDSKYRITR